MTNPVIEELRRAGVQYQLLNHPPSVYCSGSGPVRTGSPVCPHEKSLLAGQAGILPGNRGRKEALRPTGTSKAASQYTVAVCDGRTAPGTVRNYPRGGLTAKPYQ